MKGDDVFLTRLGSKFIGIELFSSFILPTSSFSKSEEVGFEPTVGVIQHLFSRQTHSATLPLFQRKDEL